jgi:SAM-dependent methyltransferase
MSNAKDKYVRPGFEERWRQRFVEFADNDDDAGIAGWSITGLEARYRNFQRVWPGDTAGSLWLDVGCGAGTYSRFLVSRRISVVGMDYSFPTVLKARAKGVGGEKWVVADVTHLPVADAIFNGVMCFGVMQALAEAEPAVRELIRAVKPGGRVWVDALNEWCLPTVWDRLGRWARGRPKHLRYDSPGQLRRIMKSQGCEDVRLYWVPILPQRFRRCQWILESPPVRWIWHYVPFLGAAFSHAFVLEGRRADRTVS